jgi:hypothetical protein
MNKLYDYLTVPFQLTEIGLRNYLCKYRCKGITQYVRTKFHFGIVSCFYMCFFVGVILELPLRNLSICFGIKLNNHKVLSLSFLNFSSGNNKW